MYTIRWATPCLLRCYAVTRYTHPRPLQTLPPHPAFGVHTSPTAPLRFGGRSRRSGISLAHHLIRLRSRCIVFPINGKAFGLRVHRGFSPFRVGADPSAASGRASEVRCDRDRELKKHGTRGKRAIYRCNEVEATRNDHVSGRGSMVRVRRRDASSRELPM